MSQQTKSSSSHSDEPLRRGFLVKFSAALIGGIVAIVPAVLGGGFFLTPLLKKKKADEGSDGYYLLGSAETLLAGGPPRAFKVIGSKQDAWTTYAETALGAVYVKMNDDGSLKAFNASCPHLGCAVDYKEDKNAFICPCHDSSFSLEGDRNNEIPPRNMDALEAEVRNGNEIWVKFESFRAGTSAKIPVT